VESFPAKLLLFGEYTVLNGSQALAIPLNKWSGKWVQHDISGKMSLIPEYFHWLSKVELVTDEIYERLVSDHDEGWLFDSDIPVGYGVGSSGAYVAGVFDRYLADKSSQDFEAITDKLAQMEAYFHGSSSGLDPLVSYTGKAVHKDENGNFQQVGDKGWPEGYKVYFIDSGSSRETSSLVNRYKERSEDHATTRKIKNRLMPLVNEAIQCYLKGDSKKLEDSISSISRFQREYFEEVIPEEIQKKWDALSAQPGTYVKLCGAGGGGYFIVIDTKGQLQETQSDPDNNLIALHQ